MHRHSGGAEYSLDPAHPETERRSPLHLHSVHRCVSLAANRHDLHVGNLVDEDERIGKDSAFSSNELDELQ